MTYLTDRLITWARTLFGPPRHPNAAPALPGWTPRVPPRPTLPPHRSPYASDDAPLTGETTTLVRPYLTAAEQRQRRRELALAALGLDTPGPYWIHGIEVA